MPFQKNHEIEYDKAQLAYKYMTRCFSHLHILQMLKNLLIITQMI